MRNEIGKTVESLTGLVAKEMDTRINERIDHFHEFIISSYLQDFLSQSNMDFEKMVNMQGYIDEKDNEWTAAPMLRRQERPAISGRTMRSGGSQPAEMDFISGTSHTMKALVFIPPMLQSGLTTTRGVLLV